MKQEIIGKLEGKQTIETIAKELNITKNSAANLITKLRKEGYLTTSGGGKQKRIYTISPIKQQNGEKSMFDIINKHSKTKIIPNFKHAAFGDYTVENALIDAILTKDARTILAALNLYNQIRNWKKLHLLAKQKEIEQETGALYDTARLFIKTRKMPENIRKSMRKTDKHKTIIPHLKPDSQRLKKISREWNTTIPFSEKDLEELR